MYRPLALARGEVSFINDVLNASCELLAAYTVCIIRTQLASKHYTRHKILMHCGKFHVMHDVLFFCQYT